MIGQNSFSNTNTNPDMITSAATPVPPPQPEIPKEPKGPRKSLPLPVVVGLSLVAGIALAVGVYFLFLDPNREGGTKVEVYDATNVSDGSKSEEETIKTLDQRIDKASGDEEVIDAKLSKARYLFIEEEYDDALTILNTIETSGLDDYNLYRVYNHLFTAYEGKGDKTTANRYKTLADEAYARESANYSE